MLYVGIDGTSKLVKKIYVGNENGISKEVTKMYSGNINNISKVDYTLSIPEPEPVVVYDYGDGSKNMTTNGYNNILYLNGTKLSSTFGDQGKAGNCYYSLSRSLGQTLSSNGSSLSSATNYMKYDSNPHFSGGSWQGHTFTHSTINGEYTFCYYWYGWSYITSSSIADFKLTIDGAGYTLKEAVQNNFIKPIVLTYSGGDAVGDWSAWNHTANSVMRLYDNSGGTQTTPVTGWGVGDCAYGAVTCWFMTNSGHNFTGATFNAKWVGWYNVSNYLSSDGLSISCTPIENYRFTLNSY